SAGSPCSAGIPSAGSPSGTEKLVQSLRHQGSAFLQEGFVTIDPEERGIGRNTLCLKCRGSRLLDHRREVLTRRFGPCLTVRLAPDEAEVCDVVRFAPRIS